MNPLHALNEVRATDRAKENLRAQLTAARARQTHPRFFPTRPLALTACAAALALCAGGVWAWRSPTAYISVDVNPSVELTLNRFDRVIDACGYNEDGIEVLSDLPITGKYYTDAVDALLSDTDFVQYLGKDCALTFTVIADDIETLQTGLQSCNGYQKYDASSYASTAECREEAHHNGFSFGKYEAYQALCQVGGSVSLDECRDLTMAQLQQEIKACLGHGSAPQSEFDDENCEQPSASPGHHGADHHAGD